MRTTLREKCAAISMGMALLALSCLVSACSDDATQANAPKSIVPLTGATQYDTTVYATNDSTYLTRIATNARFDLVGSGGGYTATTLLRVYPTNFALRDTSNVLSAALHVLFAYHQGKLPGVVEFTMYRLTKEWDPSTATWDTVTTDLYESGTSRGTFNVSITSDSQWVDIPLDTAMTREWLSSNSDANKYGFALVPTGNSTIVGGFKSYETDSTNQQPTVSIISAGPTGYITDTLAYTVYYDTFVANSSLPTNSATLELQAGVAVRTGFRFDLSFLKTGTLINTAQLSVDLLPPPSFNAPIADSTIFAHLASEADFLTFESSYSTLSPVSGTSTMRGDVRHIIQSMVRGPNYGMVLRAPSTTEFSTLDEFLLRGHLDATPALRPRIHLTYSIINLGKRP